jgi:hypothetical protein
MKRLSMVAALLIFTGIASAQSMEGMQHSTAVVRGSDNPEAISDAVAYHLVFVHLGNLMADAKTKGHAYALVASIGLSPEDRDVFVATITNYKTQHDSNIAKLPKDYSAQRDAFVRSTRDYLAAHLSRDGQAYLERYVRIERAHMTVTAPVASK